MKVYELRREQHVPRPLEEVFEFFARPENLEAITPAQLRFQILTPSPIDMKVGTLIDYALRISGMPIHWRTLITSYDPPHSFIDEQLKGPYAFWHHRHTFRAIDGGTLIGDEVRYALPFGIAGTLAHAVYVRRSVENIFAHRTEVIAAKFKEQES